MIYFITDKFVDNRDFMINSYGVNYFSYVIIGYAFSDIFATCMVVPGNIISRERALGTFESLLVSPHSLYFILIINSIPELFKSAVRISIFLIIGILIGLRMDINIRAISAAPFLIISVMMFLSFSMFFSGLILLNWRLIHIVSVFITLSTVLSGAFYPLKYLPEALRTFVSFLPFAFTLEKLRLLLTGGGAPATILSFISIVMVVTIFVSYYFFNKMEKISRRIGTILKY